MACDILSKGRTVNLYLDVDGVLLGSSRIRCNQVVLAQHAEPFLDFALQYFDCYWLTTHCDGTSESVLAYLRPYCSAHLLRELVNVRPTRFRTLKTEVLTGNFYWVEDTPLQAEIRWLKSCGLLSRWIKVDTRKRPDDLVAALAALRAVVRDLPATGGAGGN